MIVVGMNDPSFSDPKLALSPKFPNSTGKRLWLMAEVPMSDWIRLSRRVNVLLSKKWSDQAARQSGARLRKKLDETDETVVVLGKKTWQSLGLPATAWFGRVGHYVLIPHPSGRCRNYNYKRNVARVKELLRTHLYEKETYEWLNQRASRLASRSSARYTRAASRCTETTTSTPATCMPPCSRGG